MKRLLLILSMISVIFVNHAYAQNKSLTKVSRGVINVVSAPLEVPKQARAYWIEGAYKTDHILVWVATGAVWGMVQGIKRVGSGVWDILSFPIDKPANYEPLFKPDFVLDQWPSDPNVFIFKKDN